MPFEYAIRRGSKSCEAGSIDGLLGVATATDSAGLQKLLGGRRSMSVLTVFEMNMSATRLMKTRKVLKHYGIPVTRS